MDANDTFTNVWQQMGDFTSLVNHNSIVVDDNAVLNAANKTEVSLEEYHLGFDSQKLLDDFDGLLTYMDNSQPQSQNEVNQVVSQVFGPVVPNQGLVPSNTNFLGQYNFTVEFEPQQGKISKALTWTYSEVCKRFYVSRVKKWPIRVVCEYPPPENCYIRAMLVFTQADHVSKLVERCPLHLTKPEEEDLKFPLAYVLRNTDENAIYQLDDSKRHSVAIPYTPPQAGNAFSAFYYSFGCLSTCVGGINRRPVKLVITLEEKGTILGRAAFDIKCSASPGRDRMADEKKIEVAAKKASEQSLKRPMLARQNSNEPATAGRAVTMEQVIPTKRIKSDGTIYTIQTDNEADYLILSRVANGLKTLRRAQMAQSSEPVSFSNGAARSQSQSQETRRLSQPGPSGVEKPVKMEADSSQTTNSSGTDSQKQRTRGVTVQKIKITTSFNHEPSDI